MITYERLIEIIEEAERVRCNQLYEKYDGQYYVTYIISFNKADNIEEFENDLMNGIVFDK